MLLNVDVGDVEPDVTEVCGGFANLGKDYSCLVGVALVRKYAADTVCSPDVLWVVSQNLLSML